MPRSAPLIQKNITQAEAGKWFETKGTLHGVDASLKAGATAAVIDVYGSNAGQGVGVKLATITLSAATPSDGFVTGLGKNGWHFVRSQVVSTTGGVDFVAASIGEND